MVLESIGKIQREVNCMEFKGIQKREEGKFITRYDITYETVDKK